jgi:hypothetical protein
LVLGVGAPVPILIVIVSVPATSKSITLYSESSIKVRRLELSATEDFSLPLRRRNEPSCALVKGATAQSMVIVENFIAMIANGKISSGELCTGLQIASLLLDYF